MSILDFILAATDYILFVACIFILAGSVYITFKLRFVQLRIIPKLFSLLRASSANKGEAEGDCTISPHKALFTAMSTTMGVSTFVGPVIAIHLGGPGALLGYLLTSFFGSAATYAEVSLGIQHRKQLENGVIMGGPMQYLKTLISPFAAKWYAACCLVLMTVWSGAQANQLAAIFDSPLLGAYRIPTLISGVVIAALTMLTLMGGIKRVAALSSKLVPTMFSLYMFACLWIIVVNLDQFGAIMKTILAGAFSPYQMATGTLVGGVVGALRWGIFKGTQANEAGVGTQAIPHSMAETKDPVSQGMLAMLSTYMAGAVAFISGYVALITNTWQDSSLPLGVSMVAASFEIYFSSIGIAIVALSALLFAFGTILGNCYNGSQCFGYLTNNKGVGFYFLAAACMVLVGAVAEVKTVWSLIDIVLAFMIVPHMSALIKYAWQDSPSILKDIDAKLEDRFEEDFAEFVPETELGI